LHPDYAVYEALRRTKGNKNKAAKMLNLKRTTLVEKIKKKKIDGCWEDPHFLKNLKPPV